MKPLFALSLLILSLVFTPLMAQVETLVLKPGSEGEDTWFHDRDGHRDKNYATKREIVPSVFS